MRGPTEASGVHAGLDRNDPGFDYRVPLLQFPRHPAAIRSPDHDDPSSGFPVRDPFERTVVSARTTTGGSALAPHPFSDPHPASERKVWVQSMDDDRRSTKDRSPVSKANCARMP
jgi:hypothetical protein